ncbi:hypothetical protein Tco_0417409, partial [Tanacetum coccineum]
MKLGQPANNDNVKTTEFNWHEIDFERHDIQLSLLVDYFQWLASCSAVLGWAYAFHQDKASSVRVPVANVTLFSSAHLLRENTDSVHSNQRIRPTAPSVPLKIRHPPYGSTDKAKSTRKTVKTGQTVSSNFEEGYFDSEGDENVHANPSSIIESIPVSPIPIEDSEPVQEEINIFLVPDDLIPPGVENDDSEDEDNESSILEPSSPHPPPEPPDVCLKFKPDTAMKNDEEIVLSLNV